MSFLQENNTQNLAARITDKGRKKIAQGNFNISYFQVGDSEYDYKFSEFDGNINIAQKVLMPFDKDSQVKYPYKVSPSTLTGTTYGIPIQSSTTETIKNNIPAAGYVSGYAPFSGCTGTAVQCDGVEVNVGVGVMDGTSILIVPTGNTFNNTTYITVVLGTLCPNNVITASNISWIYRIVSITTGLTFNTIRLDRNTPFLGELVPGTIITIFPNDCADSWDLNNVWSQWPAGLDPTVDEQLSGYTSNIFVSTKEFFGYNTSSGQTSNTGTAITNSWGDLIIVPPEEQHSLSIIHYSKANDILIDPDLAFKYEDYIDHTVDGSDYFEIYIPFMMYERNTGTTIGARFFMDTADYFINSTASDTRINQMKFRYLLDEFNNRVGKIFVNHQVIVFDDQEIVAILDYKSNRRYTLPIPRISMVPIDSQCGTCGDLNNPMLGGTGDTVYVSYMLAYSGTTIPSFSGLTGLHLNHYLKIVGTAATGDVAIKFNANDFRFMTPYSIPLDTTTHYMANQFLILAQKIPTGTQPDPANWKIMDFTSQIPNHTSGVINPANLRNAKFVINSFDYEQYSTLYDLEAYLGSFPDEPSSSPEFGDSQPFTGSVKLTRASDVEVMRYLVNLPLGYFETTQNPSYVSGGPKRITEVALLDSNKDVVVIAKASSPVKRIGTQVLAVKIDI